MGETPFHFDILGGAIGADTPVAFGHVARMQGLRIEIDPTDDLGDFRADGHGICPGDLGAIVRGLRVEASFQIERSCPSQNGARSLRLKILPESSRGRSAAKSTRLGTL
jgi:hypothetical protein